MQDSGPAENKKHGGLCEPVGHSPDRILRYAGQSEGTLLRSWGWAGGRAGLGCQPSEFAATQTFGLAPHLVGGLG